MEWLRKQVRQLTDHDDNMVLTRWLFLRALAVVCFVAFLSFHVQQPGLIGSNGILSVQDTLNQADTGNPVSNFLQYPTISWLDASDQGLAALTGGGMLLSLLLFFNVVPRATLFLLWLTYLSTSVNGQVFMSYQWDALLIETLFLSVFIAPGNIRPTDAVKPPLKFGVTLLRFLLFKLVFLSGILKLLSGDPTWRGLTAMQYHYYTQPLPNPVTWYVAQLPNIVHTFSTASALFLEIAVPLLIFAPWRRVRYIGAAGIVLLQSMILSTGNYAFFNLLTIVLCIVVVDDTLLARVKSWLPERVLPTLADAAKTPFTYVAVALLMIVLLLNPMLMAADSASMPFDDELQTVDRFRTVNTYGLFTVMTTERPEIVLQGSNDGENWKTYEFRYKPGNLGGTPPIVAPHQPRVDWQLWFAALRSPQQSPWFGLFVQKLLEGSDEVEQLLAYNPFPNEPPTYIRAVQYKYKFTDWETKRETGNWWTRQRQGMYLPPVSLSNN